MTFACNVEKPEVGIKPDFFFLLTALGSSKPSDSSADVDLSVCGINYCPAVPEPANKSAEAAEAAEDPNSDNFSAAKSDIYKYAAVCLACSILSAIIVAVLVDPLSK